MDENERLAALEAKVKALETGITDAYCLANTASMLAQSLAVSHQNPGAVLDTFRIFADRVEAHTTYSQASEYALEAQERTKKLVVELLTNLSQPPASVG